MLNKIPWFIQIDFTSFSRQVSSVSGHGLQCIFKTRQIVAGTRMIRQFHKFFNLIFGGFLTFGTTVTCRRRKTQIISSPQNNFNFLILKMENLCKRFPHLSERILNQVNDQSLNKVKLISGHMLEYLDKERFFWIRLIKKYQNPHYCRYGYHFLKLFSGSRM